MSAATANFKYGKLPTFEKGLIMKAEISEVAGVAGLEPATPGFGDRCSSH
jgi:hypothetical protein